MVLYEHFLNSVLKTYILTHQMPFGLLAAVPSGGWCSKGLYRPFATDRKSPFVYTWRDLLFQRPLQSQRKFRLYK